MTEEQAKALKVGDKVQFIYDDGPSYLTLGKVYEIRGVDEDGDPYIYDDDGEREYIIGEFSRDYEIIELATPQPSPYRIEIVGTSADFGESGMVHISAYVNDELLAHLRDIEAEQGREAKRAKIREQIAKLEAELESLG